MGDLADDYDMMMRLEDRITECKYCGKGGLHWTVIDGNYRLENCMGEIHSCSDHKHGK